MIIGVPRETADGENRVALVPDTARRFVQKGLHVRIENAAGGRSNYPDEEYRAAGAETIASASDADVIVRVQEPTLESLGNLKEGATLVSLLYPLQRGDLVRKLVERKLSAVALDMIPRTTLAQSMDVLSSQANLAGYKAVVHAADLLPKFFPMLMTAAGTIRPAKVLVLGAGVAGLQAIATARRLGAVVEAFDVRAAAQEQVESLGARFITVDMQENAEGEGGYAKETSKEYQRRQHELIHKHLAESDVGITTALIPGRRAPTLITEPMVRGMRPGSVIVDLAASMGGNCELTVPGQEVVRHGVTVVGQTNLPSAMAHHASQLFSRNVEKLLFHLLNKEATEFAWNFDDEIVRGCAILRRGEIVHPKVKEAAK